MFFCVILCFLCLDLEFDFDEIKKCDIFIVFFKYTKKTIIVFIISVIGFILIPSEEVIYKMIISSYITPNNISVVGETAEDIIDYITEKIDTIVNDEDEAD